MQNSFFGDYSLSKREGINRIDYSMGIKSKMPFLNLIYRNGKLDSVIMIQGPSPLSVIPFKVINNDSAVVFKTYNIDKEYGRQDQYYMYTSSKVMEYKFLNEGVTFDSLIYCRAITITKNNCIGVGGLIKQNDTVNLLGKLLQRRECKFDSLFYKIQYDNRLDNKFTFLSLFYFYHPKTVLPK